MRIICNNVFITMHAFKSFREFSNFLANQKLKKRLELCESYGDFHYCYLVKDSLTQEALFAITFDSDQEENNLDVLVWYEQNLLVLNTGTHIYFIDKKYEVKQIFEVSTPLIGFHVTHGDNLLILEEASVRLVASDGKILRSELFDIIEDFDLNDGVLSLKIDKEVKKFEMI